ncbi:MAG: GWxTD domain-containing protein, partial [Pyrinomonadaceae bacterium]
MSLPKLLSSLGAASLVLSLTASSFSQSKPQRLPDRKQRNVKSEPRKVYSDWPRQDVALIITPDEERAYAKLTSDEEREQFIQHFWLIRDPDPDTEENEYKDQYYERIAYANERFSSGKAGWLTDRGKIYIKFGKPDEIESHPAGGSYERPSYEGGGSASTYPFEKWFYRFIPGVGSGIELEFIDPTGTGEYRVAKNPYEKLAFLHVPGGATPDEILG